VTVPFRIFSLLLCLLVAGPMSPAAWAVARPENRVGDFFLAPQKSTPADLDQTAGLRWENPGCGYDFASGVCTYAYDANGNQTNIVSATANGVSIGYSYDALNRLTNVVDNRLGLATKNTAYTFLLCRRCMRVKKSPTCTGSTSA
jgi:hypothetical protein